MRSCWRGGLVVVVFQDFMTYDLTARENIGVGDLNALTDLDRITSAARAASIHDAILDLPRGYDTMLTRIFFQHTDRDNPVGLIDELPLHIVPLTPGAGTRLFDGVSQLRLELAKSRAAASLARVTYRVPS
jgi:hypothetical protein